MEGKRPRGRPRMNMIDDETMGSYEHKRKAQDREVWRVCKLNIPHLILH